ncbi:polyhydroxybutyrate depolymerase [Salpingoeca rosetta]|uniref:Polyhydroxybutyrate depolymerase n=1 Tax=Salpingoeca rosetta (strain ATCC 50818 / BSB-021) TaxID=946362 RepID=F2TWD9_SALR5|nr:polyhydroxybutyrate depolymerase [Salpingoeca rosetta]EGD72385.1 polyhydroxybutyrate depolymerase [Salpingoeca rosetta]|eukprot:XP_004998954.1 polyhydroxybutyrate depolymerase [Salpingoeca rosetta]
MSGQWFAIACVLAVGSTAALADPLPRLNIDIDAISVAGISAGGAFASQFHVAHSSNLVGAAIFAGPPYDCAHANMEAALMNCMKEPMLIQVDKLVQAAKTAATLNAIDDTSNMSGDKVWIWTGKRDTVVKSGVVEKTKEFYERFVNNTSNIKYIDSYPAEHAWITTTYGHSCDFLGDPYINNCSFDAVGDFLNHIYDGNIKPAGTFVPGNMLRFEQSQYVKTGSPGHISFGEAGFAYIPRQCSSGTKCRLVVTFHGCNQDIGTIGEEFVVHNGLNEYAETNNLVILYPQVKKSMMMPENPQGCFDWWGYTDLKYTVKAGPQLQAVTNMVVAITGQFGGIRLD